MESRPRSSSEPHRKDSAGTGGENRIARRLSRSLHLRNHQGKHQARPDSVGSLDGIFETHGSDELPIPITRAPSLTSNEKSFIDNTHGIYEKRDGFFDTVFLAPEDVDNQTLMDHAEGTLPLAFRKKDPLSLTHFFPRQCHEAWSVIHRVTTTRSGVKLLKSFLAFFISYILCLVPAVRERSGRYAYIMVISSILNHPGRTLGAQIDGTLLTILGTAAGLGWGAFGLWVSIVTATARVGFGAILALFLFIHIFTIACLRSYYIRTYQFVICAGIAIIYTCLAEISRTEISWSKLLSYGVPWLIGQTVSLVVCGIVAPDAGSRPLAVGIHQVFGIMLDGIPPVRDSVRIRRRLAQAFVSMSQVHRDLVIDFSITTLSPEDVLILRNSVQAISQVSLKTETRLSKFATSDASDRNNSSHQELPEFIIKIDKIPGVSGHAEGEEMAKFVTESLEIPTGNLLLSMKSALQSCDAALMDMCGHRRYLGPPYNISSDIHSSLVDLRKQITTFNTRQEDILASKRLPRTYSRFPDVVKIFAFCLSLHQAANSIESLVAQLNELRQRQPKYPCFHLPSYPFWKAIHRTNAQVRHDRGGVTAGSYFRSFNDIAKIIKKIKSRDFQPVQQKGAPTDGGPDTFPVTTTAHDLTNSSESRVVRLRHRIWTFLHRMQGFETRFGLKTALVTSLLAVPAYLVDGHPWWDRHDGWWGVVMGWLIMGPRTGGNVQDLFTRAFCAVLGSIWAALAYAAGNGNPYVMAAFAVIFMLPMMYRYTQSTHPRSGMVGCISFTVISLSEVIEGGRPSVAEIAATRGASMVFGVVASIIVNWVLWPFVARHDLRKGIASMIFNCSIAYRSIISQYAYYEEGDAPTEEDIKASEILEGRLREGFVRLRQLLGLTRHEIRLRAPFDPLPYSALMSACEQFFDHVVTVRQSSLFYHPHFIGDDSEAAMDLLSYRRDQIATVLTNLYVLSGALRADRPVPKYLPSAAIARKRLLDRVFELEREYADGVKHPNEEQQRELRLGQIYSYSYNDSLTGCVKQAKQLEKYTKIIVGEQGWNDIAMLATSVCALLSVSATSLAWEWGQGHGHKSTINYTTIGGFFLQDDLATDPKSFDYVRPPLLQSSFGAIVSYPTDKEFDRQVKKTQWQRFEHYVDTLNRNADKNTQYKVLFLARHGEGYHNAAESYYGTPAWNTYYTSPLTRSATTANLTFAGLDLPDTRPFVPTVKELLREGISIRSCDERSSKTALKTLLPNFRFENGFTETDLLWRGDEGETDEARVRRTKIALDDIFSHDSSTWVSLTTHSGQIATALKVLGHRVFSLSTGQAIPVLVKARTVEDAPSSTTLVSFTPEATCFAPPVTSIQDQGCVCSSAAIPA
ncbi:hypothetical protein E0Z10_g8157 [Xylaria hypoxylon]|uniref:Integral membrane bound transporter domain-containing protein n=1 Tax=Xylaria hypoxylon TaxID=37992 RepID=A0A4Z0YKG8_9PEZI|nr:hypothetical protein E0Z10_g8157 [Xylaria hypoxylon]